MNLKSLYRSTKSLAFGLIVTTAAAALVLLTGSPARTQSGIELQNISGNMGGHTPRGFQGQGNGIFVGDNLNTRFPNGDGVQAFISFDLADAAGIDVANATLVSRYLRVNGTPFADLGNIRLERINFPSFSSVIWNLAVDPQDGCILTISTDQNRAECDLTKSVQKALNDGAAFLQFRLRFEKISDSDGQQDLAQFFKRNVNANEGGVFTLTLR